MLATRAFLFMLIEIQAKSTNRQNFADFRMEVPAPIKLLLQICIESAKKTSQILGSLQQQNLLGENDPTYFDLIYEMLILSV